MSETRRALQLDLSRAASLDAWRQFELASEQADRLGMRGRSFWVYVVELDDHLNLDRPDANTVWVGQTHLAPDERFEQHKSGYRADHRVAQNGTALRPDLYAEQPELRSRQEADAFSALLIETLENDGYSVYREI